MPRINLLPIKAAQRQENTKRELLFFLLLFICLFGGLYFWHGHGSGKAQTITSQISRITQTNLKLAKDVTRIEEFKEKSAIFEEKAEIIRDLLRQKVGPAKMLDDLANIITKEKRVWLTVIQEDPEVAGHLLFGGGAIEHEDISSFQKSLTNNSPFFKHVKLNGVTTSLQNDVRFLEWTITCMPDFSGLKEE